MPPARRSAARSRLPPVTLQNCRDLRHPLTEAEKRLWHRLRDHGIGFHVRRQHVWLNRFIADFYCAASRLCIEIDGDTHARPDQAVYDEARTSLLQGHGYRVIRFANADVIHRLEGVVEAIREACWVGLRQDG